VISSKEHRGYIPRYIHVSVYQRKTQRSVVSDTDLHRCTNPFFCGILYATVPEITKKENFT